MLKRACELIWGHSQACKNNEKEAVEHHYNHTTCPKGPVYSTEDREWINVGRPWQGFWVAIRTDQSQACPAWKCLPLLTGTLSQGVSWRALLLVSRLSYRDLVALVSAHLSFPSSFLQPRDFLSLGEILFSTWSWYVYWSLPSYPLPSKAHVWTHDSGWANYSTTTSAWPINHRGVFNNQIRPVGILLQNSAVGGGEECFSFTQ